MSLELKIRFKMLKISKRIKDLKAVIKDRFSEVMGRQEDDLKMRVVSTSVCMIGVTAISLHNISAALNSMNKTMGFRKLFFISIGVGTIFSYVWWKIPNSREPLTGYDIETVFNIVKESGHAPSQHIQPIIDFFYAGVFQSGAYDTLDWGRTEEMPEEQEEGYGAGYEHFLKSKQDRFGSYEEDDDDRIDPMSQTIPKSISLRNLRPVIKDPDKVMAIRNTGSVMNSLIDTASTRNRNASFRSDTAEDLPYDWAVRDI